MFGRCQIATFYSYKGGTGRTMALANFAWALAASGKKVLMIDWDLEAPGLHRFFHPFLIDPGLEESDGLIDLFWSLASLKGEPSQGDIEGAFEAPIQRLDVERYFLSSPKGCLDFIGAGRQTATYSERVNTFDWRHFYRMGGARVLEIAKAHLRESYDWVLIDSRTGVSDTSGICTIQLPDIVVAAFTMNRQSIDGVASILGSIRDDRAAYPSRQTIALFPLATRIESGELDQLTQARTYARETMNEFLPEHYELRTRGYWNLMEIPYVPAYAFEEALAIFREPSGRARASNGLLSAFEKMTQCVSGDDVSEIPSISESVRRQAILEYSLNGFLQETPTPESDTIRAFRAMRRDWLRSGKQWQFLLTDIELSVFNHFEREAISEDMDDYLVQSNLQQDFFAFVERTRLISLGGAAAIALVAVALYKSMTGDNFGAILIAATTLSLGLILPGIRATLRFRGRPLRTNAWETLLITFAGRPGYRPYRLPSYLKLVEGDDPDSVSREPVRFPWLRDLIVTFLQVVVFSAALSYSDVVLESLRSAYCSTQSQPSSVGCELKTHVRAAPR